MQQATGSKNDFVKPTHRPDIHATSRPGCPRYNESKWHQDIARELVFFAQLSPGCFVVDVATGTGLAAFHAAHAVGRGGKVVGVDIAKDMLKVAKKTRQDAGGAYDNVEFLEG